MQTQRTYQSVTVINIHVTVSFHMSKNHGLYTACKDDSGYIAHSKTAKNIKGDIA